MPYWVWEYPLCKSVIIYAEISRNLENSDLAFLESRIYPQEGCRWNVRVARERRCITGNSLPIAQSDPKLLQVMI